VSIGRAALVVMAPIMVAAAVAFAATRGGDADGANATINIHFSKFAPGTITVPAGEPVTITLVNDDPIGHEWIVGTDDVHARHRTGTEPVHDEIPTEVTLEAFETRETTVTFDAPGEYAFICHLPGHEAYGMAGTVRVEDQPTTGRTPGTARRRP
jgi:uncharacterized cupredoxin-like copper-binding protein